VAARPSARCFERIRRRVVTTSKGKAESAAIKIQNHLPVARAVTAGISRWGMVA
jgi:hypothetical protein